MKSMTVPWGEIVTSYDGAPDQPAIQAIQALARQIMSTPLSDGLHGWMSEWALCIAQAAELRQYEGPYLQVSAVADDIIEFRYVDCADPDRQWHRNVLSVDAWDRLVRFLDQLHWFSDLEHQSLPYKTIADSA